MILTNEKKKKKENLKMQDSSNIRETKCFQQQIQNCTTREAKLRTKGDHSTGRMVAWLTWVHSCNTQAGSGLHSNTFHWQSSEEVRMSRGQGRMQTCLHYARQELGSTLKCWSWAKVWRPNQTAQRNSDLLMYLGSGQKT